MSWSVIKSFKNWRKLIEFMIKTSNKYTIFDIRVVTQMFMHLTKTFVGLIMEG